MISSVDYDCASSRFVILFDYSWPHNDEFCSLSLYAIHMPYDMATFILVQERKFMFSKQNVSILVSIIEIVLARAISLVMYWCYWAQKSVANYPAHIYSPYNYTTYAGALQCTPYCNVMKLQPFQSASALPGKHVAKAQFAATHVRAHERVCRKHNIRYSGYHRPSLDVGLKNYLFWCRLKKL